MTPLKWMLGVHGRGSSGYQHSPISISTRAWPVFATQPQEIGGVYYST